MLNLNYQNVYLKNTDEETLAYYEYFLRFFNLDKADFFIVALCPSHMKFCSKKNKNLKGRIIFSDEDIHFDLSEDLYFNNEEEVFFRRNEIFKQLNVHNPFFENNEIVSIKKHFSFNIEEELSDFRKTYDPARNLYMLTKEEALSLSNASFQLNKTISKSGCKLISHAVFNYFIEKHFSIKPDNSVFNYLWDNFNHLTFLSKRDDIIELKNLFAYEDLLFFSENGFLTKESKELIELNFQY